MKRTFFFCLLTGVMLGLIGACSVPEPELASSKQSVLGTVRHLPFLPGQRMGILQGNNGTPTHTATYGNYYAIDFSLPADDDWGIPVVAVGDGVVNSVVSGMADANTGCVYGNTVVYCNNFRASSDTCERAGHLREVFVRPGEKIKGGQVIGLLGTSGWSEGHHLHSQLQAKFDGGSIASQYLYLETENDPEPHTGTWPDTQTAEHPCDSSPSRPCAISVNAGIMGTKAESIPSAQKGTLAEPRALLEANEGWGKYGWYSSFTPCSDGISDANITCDNEVQVGNNPSFRKNAYVRRYIGGTNGDTIVVYDALSGAFSPFVIRSGFLKNASYGWDTLGGPQSRLGMPLEDEKATSTGAEQHFQWGYLRWMSATNAITIHQYPKAITSTTSVGPGVFAPDSTRTVHYWNRGISYKIADAWSRNGGRAALGLPASDNGFPHGVHVWGKERFLIQNFEGGTLGPSAIMYDPRSDRYAEILGTIPQQGWNRAYVIRTGFWEWYRYQNGITRMKAPLGDEYPYGTGARQDFLCGWLEWNNVTQTVEAHENPNAPGCSDISPPPKAGADGCYGTSSTKPSEFLLETGGGSGPGPMTIACRVGPADMAIEITGPIQNGVFSQVTGSTVYLEYGSGTDGWGPYTSGKPKETWIGDMLTTGDPRTYRFILGNSVQNFNFFLYNPSTGQQGWFDLSKWTIVGDCWRDGGGLRHLNPPPSAASGSLTCTLDSSALTVNVSGPVQSLLVSGTVANPTKILYGSDTDGWSVPYSSGKAFANWNGTNAHTLVLPPNVYNFNLYLTDGSTGKWFDLLDSDYDGDSWTVSGACYKNGGAITHAPPPPPPNATISCVENGPDMTVTVTGSIPNGIWNPVPSGSPVYLEYGSDTDGWGPYTTGKPKATYSSSTTSYSMILSSNVQNFNFFLYGPSYGQTSWFNLDKWTVTGDCWRDGGGIRH